jgi:hypothetical protein
VKKRAVTNASFAPPGLDLFGDQTQRLRAGLYSTAASRL